MKNILRNIFFFTLTTFFLLLATLGTTSIAFAKPYGDFSMNTKTCTITGWICDNALNQFGTSSLIGAFFVNKDWGAGNDFLHIVSNTAIWGTANSQGITANSAKGGPIGPNNSYCGSNTNYAHWFQFKLSDLRVDNMSTFNPTASHTYYLHAIGSSDSSNPKIASHAFACSASTTNPTPGTTPGQSSTTLKLILGLPGIGFNAVGGVAPQHHTRSVTVELYDSTVTNPSGPGTHALSTSPGTVTYDNSSDNNAGYFVGNITLHLPSTPAANNKYKVLVEVPQYLYKLATDAADGTQTFTIKNNATVTTSPLLLLPGDVLTANGAKNILDIYDYTQILSCFHDASSCTTTTDGIPLADLDDNGTIDIVDINLFIQSLFHLQQIQSTTPVCNGLSCQGD